MVKISFQGAAGEVTGSNFLVEGAKHKYVVDCGLFQGGEELSRHNDEDFAYDPATVDAVAVTHAHLDHIGRLPKLVKEGFHGSIYATEATIDLARLVLDDMLGIMADRIKHHNHMAKMLYDEHDLARTMSLWQKVEYGKKYPLFAGDSLEASDAGHILGSASHTLEIEGTRLGFSGDLGHWPGLILPKPVPPTDLDALVMEATYGGTNRETDDRYTSIKAAIDWVVENKGVLLIPAFAIERTQELLFLLHELAKKGELPNIPVYLDSPLAIEALEVFERQHKFLRSDVAKQGDIFDFRRLVLTPAVPDSKDIAEAAPPKIIIAGSGMMEGGRIVHHLRNYLSNPKTYLLVIGYQAKNTLGSHILSGAETIKLGREVVPVKAKIVKAEAFSSHADQAELFEWLEGIKFRRDKAPVYVVHSDAEKANAFIEEAAKRRPDLAFHSTELGQTVEI